MNTLYIFIDESGNFDFSPNGTKFFVLTVLTTPNPFEITSPLLSLHYDLLPNYAGGRTMEEQGYFHASEDTQEVRDKVFSAISRLKEQVIRVDSIIAQKNKAVPYFHKHPERFYAMLGRASLKYTLKRVQHRSYKHFVVVFSSLFDKKKRGDLKQASKSFLKKKGLISLYFHDSKTDLCTQAADYFSWAIYRKWESSDTRSYLNVQHLIKSEFPIFEKSDSQYYEYK